MNLEEIRTKMFEAAASKRGTRCPCCDRHLKVYRRPLNASQARYLIFMAQKSGEGNPWLHVEMDFRDVSIPSRGDYAKLRYWGLIEPKPGESDRGGRSNGYWRLTDKGRAFVNGEIAVPARIHLLNNRVVGWSEATTTIKQALGKRFDYAQLTGCAA